jgi:hypothetical protein
MNKKPDRKVVSAAVDSCDLDALYVELLSSFYRLADRRRAKEIAVRLEQALNDSPEFAESIRGEEVRSLIFELRGDFEEAIRSREAEIRKILELHTLAVNTPSWEYVSGQYDFTDVSDRLDLLAVLYDRHGSTDRAIAVLRESERYCASHGLPFQGQDLLDEFERVRNGTRRKRITKPVRPHKRRAPATRT